MPNEVFRIGPDVFDAKTGDPVDPITLAKELVNLPAIVAQLNACALGRVFMTTDQLAAANALLARAWPAPKTLEVTGQVKHVVVPPDISPEQAEREYERIVNGDPVLN